LVAREPDTWPPGAIGGLGTTPTIGAMPADLAAAAIDTLERNRRGAWTCPAVDIYPHQWLWDSCFVAIGLAAHDPRRAADEVRSVLRGQWSNGMVPHMVFTPEIPDLGSTRLWRSRRDPRAPRDVDTSCITQPPVLAIAAWFVARRLDPSARGQFLAEVVPKIVEHHRWLYRERDPDHRGVVTLIHPWECGLDTTPPWMAALQRAPTPAWMCLAFRWRLTRIVRLLRRDTRYLPAAERSSDDDGLRMLALARRIKRHGFDLDHLVAQGSVLVEDFSFNALLVVANRMLTELAGDVGVDLGADLATSFAATPSALEALWDEAGAQYCSRDATTGELMTEPTIATFFALWAGLRPDRVRRVTDAMVQEQWRPEFPVPSVPTGAPQFEADRYWKGPTWINTNWIIVQGLEAQGERGMADALRQRSLQLVRDGGCAEYFNALTGAAHGAPGFSWTAALVLDLLR
jgi:hypothetical protein